MNRTLENVKSARLSQEEIDLAWKYTYLFFFKYPLPFPWHMVFREKDFNEISLDAVLSPDGRKQYGRTFKLLTFEEKIG